MGGLAGIPFAGITGFGAMAHHIPDDGSCLIVYGPHTGVDSRGIVGTVERRGRKRGGACCGSAVAAANFVLERYGNGMCVPVAEDDDEKSENVDLLLDAQQNLVGQLLLPHAKRLAEASSRNDVYVELPWTLFDTQKNMIESIVRKGANAVAGDGKIALVGGIQINTPSDMPDYFLLLQFDIFDNRGNLVESIALESSEE